MTSLTAERQAPAQPSSWNDFKPRPMSQPMVLYRSVSVPELADICRRGAIFGGGNRFNAFDGRPYVFFADEIDDRLIRQGEYVDRQVEYALRDHELTHSLTSKDARVREHADVILAEMRSDSIPYDEELAEDLRLGWDKQHFRRAAFRSSSHRKYALLFRVLARLETDLGAAYETYDEQFGRMLVETEQRITKLPYSSAILVTGPISGGFVYSNEFGFSGHGKPEYGFRPGQLTVANLAEILLIRACRVVGKCASSDLSVLCAADAEAPVSERGDVSPLPKGYEMPPLPLPPGFVLAK